MLNPTTLPPGFRFHPTDEELILHYLRNRAASMPLPVSIIAEVDIYKFDPWDLPAKALFGDREWYFFSPRDRKYPNGVRPNRAAASGYWKATGTDKPIVMSKGIINGNSIGVKKALVFYKGRPPKGVKTDWIMHEYRLADALMSSNNVYKPIKLRSPSMRLDDWVLCRIYKKRTHQVSLDPEQEDSGVECVAASPQSTQHNSFLKLPKSCSLSELLDAADYSAIARLLETPPDLLGSENCSFGYPNSSQPFIHGSNSSFTQQLSQTQSPVLITDNMLKRKLQTASCFEDDGELSCSAKKPTTVSRMFTCFSDHFDNTQLINHQLLNSQQTEELYKM